MQGNYNKELKRFAQKLRRNMTKEERHLWYDFLKTLPFVVKRQKIIGDYIVDFCCTERNLIIELDGSQHYDHEAKQRDACRDLYLTEKGYTVLRYANNEINCNFQGVCNDILARLELI